MIYYNQRGLLALMLEETIAAKAKANKVASGKIHGIGQEVEPMLAEPITPINTREELAKISGVSHGTIHKQKTRRSGYLHLTRGGIRLFGHERAAYLQFLDLLEV